MGWIVPRHHPKDMLKSSPLEPKNVPSFGHRVFAEMTELKWEYQVDQKPQWLVSSWKGKRGRRDSNASTEDQWSSAERHAELGGWNGASANHRTAETAGKPTEAKRGKGGICYRFRGICMALLTPWFQTSSLQNHETIHFCHLMPPSLWSFISVQSLSHVWLFPTPWTAACPAPCPSPSPRVHPNSCPWSQWCHPTTSSSVVPFFSHLQSFPASGSYQMSQLFPSSGQSTGVSASASVLPMNTQDWSPLWWTGWVSLQSKGLSRVFSNTTVQKHQFFSSELSL